VERAYLTALFDDAQSVWRHEFAEAHMRYQAARLVIFWSQSHSRCGAGKNSGPYYCPTDRGVYLDLRFFSLLLHESHVEEAAQGFIVGHEVAHHVQRLLGIAASVSAANRADPSGSRARGVRVELEADCLAGVWARSAYPRSDMSTTDLYDGLRTAHMIGDDYGAEAAGAVADPTLFTHGSSEDRKYWLRTGYRSGRPEVCNTFVSR
jgi:predicted metalloprotease